VSVSNEQRRKANTVSRAVHAPRKVRVEATVKLRAYPVIQERLEGELLAGIRKVFKYVDGDGRVNEDYMIAHADTILTYLENGICELIDFGDD
jgi:hypothetical protein